MQTANCTDIYYLLCSRDSLGLFGGNLGDSLLFV